ncbi:MAG: SDR family oxidoreductase [Ruminococcaceae bacterium]|nr:SDR family oxidoreductase [Oscillospiraceae bacterium]
MGRLNDKICIVTGGNSGIGEATAKLFAQEGATVIITARRENELQRVADEINESGGKCFYIPGDVRVTEDVENVVEKTVEMFGRIDVLVNNAGIADYHRPTIKLEDDFWDNVHETNLKGVMRFCRAALRHMVPANKGSIVNVASIGGVYHCAGAAYSTSKAGVVSLTKNLAIQYYGSGLRFNSVSPGSTLTPLFDPENMANADLEMVEITKRVHYHPIDEMLKPIEQANAILFFASDESSGVNGQDLVVDYGGRL